MSAGRFHSLGLAPDGTVWSWGENDHGQLGDGSFTESAEPVRVQGLADIVQVSGGGFHSLALTATGEVWAWGNNLYGQLGNGEFVDSALPVKVRDPGPAIPFCCFTKVAAGFTHSVLLRDDGSVWTFGSNQTGELGNDMPYVHSNLPVEPLGLGVATDIATSGVALQSFALVGGEIWGWGNNRYGQLGDGTRTQRNAPVMTTGLSGRVMIGVAAGSYHSLGLEDTGDTWSWGLNEQGQLGTGLPGDSDVPVAVATTDTFTAVGAGFRHSLAIRSDGKLFAWGSNVWGQLGDGTTVDKDVPTETNTLIGVTSTSGGLYHSLAVQGGDDTAWGWGENWSGQLGLGHHLDIFEPAQITECDPCLGEIVDVALGFNHGLAVTADGRVWAWGRNNSGQLGNDTTDDSDLPIPVLRITDAVAVAAGFEHSLALTRTGEVWAWGENDEGQLGLDTVTLVEPIPQKVRDPIDTSLDLTGIVEIDTGDGNSSYARTEDERVLAWGDNGLGQLGINSFAALSDLPAEVVDPDDTSLPLTGVREIAGGAAFGMARIWDGSVVSWGHNAFGQLGDGSLVTLSRAPVHVSLPAAEIAISIGCGSFHALAAVASDQTFAWGENADGQLGLGFKGTIERTPRMVVGMDEAVAVAGGLFHSLARKQDGTVWAWGQNAAGELGNGSTDESLVARLSLMSRPAIDIDAGGRQSIALRAERSPWGWGDNTFGALGLGSIPDTPFPLQVEAFAAIQEISGGTRHSLALDVDGRIWAWGDNGQGQVGDGTGVDAPRPVRVVGIEGATQVAVGSHFSLALVNGRVFAWGDNDSGQLGQGTVGPDSDVPLLVSDARVDDIIAIAAGNRHSMALRSDGTVWAWGGNDRRQLGDPTFVALDTGVPRQAFISGVTAIGAGSAHSLAVTFDTQAWGWGSNTDGQIGLDGLGLEVAMPREIDGLLGVVTIDGGAGHTQALLNNGHVAGLGFNIFGQLGDGSGLDQPTPVEALGIDDAVAVQAGSGHSMVLREDGTVVSYGDNGVGQLGNPAFPFGSFTPVDVMDASGTAPLADQRAIGVGDFHSMGVDGGCLPWTWGSNLDGQLGDGNTATTEPLPVRPCFGGC